MQTGATLGTLNDQGLGIAGHGLSQSEIFRMLFS